MKQYAVTFYDLIGYIVPGLFLTLVIALGASVILDNELIFQKLYSLRWPWHLVLGYIGGHIIQAITTLALHFDVGKWWRSNNWHPDFKKELLVRLGHPILGGHSSETLPSKLTVQLAEGLITSDTPIGKVETFRALQGFFRAMTGVSALMALSCWLFFFKGAEFVFSATNANVSISPSHMGLLGLISAGCAFLFYYRFRQFAAYRLQTIFLGYYISSFGKSDTEKCAKGSLSGSENESVSHKKKDY